MHPLLSLSLRAVCVAALTFGITWTGKASDETAVAHREQDVVFGKTQTGVELAGTLTVPRGPGPFPAVVLVAGSGPMNRDEEVFGHRPFAVLADHLARRGLVVLRYDKRGVGKSTGDFAQATTLDFAGDAISAWDFLATRPEVDAKQVGAIGHSEGGMIVPTLAANRPETAFIVMLAGVGMTGGDLELLQNSLLKKAGGMDPADVAFEEETTQRWIAMVKAGETDAQIEEALRPRLEAAAAKSGGDAERAIARLHSPWWRFILTHSAIPDLEKVRCPVMALNGSKDLQVPPRENLVPIAQALARAGNTDFVIREMPGLNHLFQHAVTGSDSEYGKIKEAISPQIVAMVADWIVDHSASAKKNLPASKSEKSKNDLSAAAAQRDNPGKLSSDREPVIERDRLAAKLPQMITKPSPLLALAVAGISLVAPLAATAQTPLDPPIPAVIVVRHGEDLTSFIPNDTTKSAPSSWKSNGVPKWPTYDLPNGKTVQVHQHGLSAEGENQAVFLAKSLPTLLAANNFLPVTRVVTKDPWEGSPWPTPNPFDTAWPFIKTNNIKDVILVKAEKGTNAYGPLVGKTNKTVDKDLLAMLPYYHRSPEKFSDSILPTNAQGIPTGSTLIVWDGQGMWGPHKTDEAGKPWYWGDDIPKPTKGTGRYDTNDGANILRLLGGFKIGNDIRDNPFEKGGTLPDKMARMYVFYPRDGTGPLATNEAPSIIQANIQIEQEDAGVTNTKVIPPKYNLMVWDPVGTKGWTNIVNFEVNEVDETETSSSAN